MFVWFRRVVYFWSRRVVYFWLIQTRRSVFLVSFWSRHSVFSRSPSGCYKLHQIRLQYLLSQVSTCFFRKVSLSLSLCHSCILPLPLWFFFYKFTPMPPRKISKNRESRIDAAKSASKHKRKRKESRGQKVAIRGISLMLTLIFSISMLTTTVTPKGKKRSKSSGWFYSLPTGMNSLGIWVRSQKNFGHLQR